ncbi:MAG: hypothetical protein P8Y38_05490 [Deltaproteobacteria bacterium]|jgi:hypothetical protein
MNPNRPIFNYFIFICFTLSVFAGTAFAEVPEQIGPFRLNQPITECEQYLDMETALPVRYMEQLHEVEIRPLKGFKSGLVAYTICEKPGRVVRIKLKYADSSKNFYEKLLQRIEKRYGKSDEYRGDAFHVVIAWKWSFVNKDGENISLIVQHNTRDEEEKMGNSVKLTLTSKLEEYKSCYEKKKMQANSTSSRTEAEIEIPGLTGWNLFLPR